MATTWSALACRLRILNERSLVADDSTTASTPYNWRDDEEPCAATDRRAKRLARASRRGLQDPRRARWRPRVAQIQPDRVTDARANRAAVPRHGRRFSTTSRGRMAVQQVLEPR